MFCPFIKDECREDCAFRRVVPAATNGSLRNQPIKCELAHAAESLEMRIYKKTLEEEEQLPLR